MSLIDTLHKRDAKKNTYLPIDRSKVKDGKVDEEPMLTAGKHYFQLWLNELYLKSDRDWFKSYYPVVHSLIRFNFGNQQAEIPYIAGPSNLKNVDSNNLDKVIQLNYPLTPLMPFNGGMVEMSAGILAMQGKDYTNGFIKVLEDFSGLITVPPLSLALNVAGTLVKGVSELLRANNGELHLGLHQTFTGKDSGGANRLRSGYIAVILAETDQIATDSLWVLRDRLYKGSNQRDLFTGYTYMLFRIDKCENRDDWKALTYIKDPYEEAISEIPKNEEWAEMYINTAITKARTSIDLTDADKVRVSMCLREEFDRQLINARWRKQMKDISKREVSPAKYPYYPYPPHEPPSLSFDQVMKRAMSVKDAIAIEDSTLKELIAEKVVEARRTAIKIEDYNKLIEINPQDSLGWINKGRALYGLGIYSESLKFYDKGIEINPLHAGIWYHKGLALQKLHHDQEAKDAFSKATKLGYKASSSFLL